MTKDDDHPHDDYHLYARFCLDLAAKLPDRSNRLLLREMAAAWLTLAENASPGFAGDASDDPPATDGHAPQ